jgi:hypothetical protein
MEIEKGEAVNMNEPELMQYVEETARILYQNKEQEALERTRLILAEIQDMVKGQTEEQLQAAGEFSVAMLRELMEAYENNDMLALADCLMEKVTLFIPFFFQKM